METRFVANEDGSAYIETFTDKNLEYFRFETRTKFDIGNGASITVRTRRRMAAGLLEHFRRNQAFREQIMRQNQKHAEKFLDGLPAAASATK